MQHHPLAVMLATILATWPAASWGVVPEKGPAYLTDSHGASGVAHAFLELSEVAPEYEKYWKGALDWLVSVAQRDQHGYLFWYMSTTAPKGHPSHRVNASGMCHTVRMFLAGYDRCGDERYRRAALDATRTLVERLVQQRNTPYGTAYVWTNTTRRNDRALGMLAGHSHGLGNLIDTLLDAYEHAKDPQTKSRLRDALRGILVNLRWRAQQTKAEGHVLLAWPARNNPSVIETGYCYGQAGLAIPLLRLAETMPELKLDDGTTALSLANGSLRYLMSVAQPFRGGYIWPYMRHSKASRNIGFGSGTGGIGMALLRGAQVNRASDPQLAEQCRKYARGAVQLTLNMALSSKVPNRLKQPGGDAGFGLCGGAGGAGWLLIRYAEQFGDQEPELTTRINRAVERIGRLVIASATEVDGTLVCPDRTHFKRVNLALDYGQTGIVLGLTLAGKYLHNDELLGGAKKVADYIVRRAVPEGGGYKFAQFHPLPK